MRISVRLCRHKKLDLTWNYTCVGNRYRSDINIPTTVQIHFEQARNKVLNSLFSDFCQFLRFWIRIIIPNADLDSGEPILWRFGSWSLPAGIGSDKGQSGSGILTFCVFSLDSIRPWTRWYRVPTLYLLCAFFVAILKCCKRKISTISFVDPGCLSRILIFTHPDPKTANFYLKNCQ